MLCCFNSLIFIPPPFHIPSGPRLLGCGWVTVDSLDWAGVPQIGPVWSLQRGCSRGQSKECTKITMKQKIQPIYKSVGRFWIFKIEQGDYIQKGFEVS